LRRPPLLHLPRRLLREAAALRTLRPARLFERLLCQAAALRTVCTARLLRRLLPQTILFLHAARLAGVVHVRVVALLYEAVLRRQVFQSEG
jgi:hypothetical protein